MEKETIRLEFDAGTILVRGPRTIAQRLEGAGIVFDARVGCWRAAARRYREIVSRLKSSGTAFEDAACGYERLALRLQIEREPFPYQREALDAWWARGGRGVVVLPTGSGKTFVAQLAMQRAGRSTLVVAPTIDLMQQWYGVLGSGFGEDVGLIGGGYHEPRPLSVTTYDSAYMHMERLGRLFGLVVFDECHHLPGPSYLLAADAALAPYRLGLTATPEREDGEEQKLDEALGPVVYRREIRELAGKYLAEYETVRIRVRLPEEEREKYREAREIYRAFVRRHRIPLGSPGGWARFLMLSSRSREGRQAFLAYREQKTIAQASPAKVHALRHLLSRHRRDRVLIFTSDNDTVYHLSRRFLMPAITHQTRIKERHETLQAFNEGTFPFLVTSRVLNEGVDVPAANVGIVLSGSGSVREHVQRLGRILRRAKDKRAILYEIVAEDTAEEFTSTRRRKHSAYD